MSKQRKRVCGLIAAALVWAMVGPSVWGQPATSVVQGQVRDSSGAAIPAVTVEAVSAAGALQKVQTNEEGRYRFRSLQPGTYTIRIHLKGFAPFEKATTVIPGSTQTVDASLVVTLEKQKVTVTDTAKTLSVNSENNASALILKGKDLDALSDDPDELQSQLQALAGPSAGPNGGEIYIDGFSGGQLPSKSAIREIRVNQNPFSAQYDKLGYGRIEILTRPGQDNWHGQVFSMFNTSALNSRNPFVSAEPGYHREFIDGNLGGPLSKKASLFFDGGRRDIQGNSIVSAIVLDDSLQQTALSQAIASPRVNNNLSSRLDYQLGANNTLTARYQFWQDKSTNGGIGQLALASQGYNTRQTEHTLQISDSQVISARAVNDTRFEYSRHDNSQIPLNRDPTLQVIGAFSGGGSALGRVSDNEDHYELHNATSLSRGKHYLTFGGRLRDVNERNRSNANFNGTFTFPAIGAYQSAEAQLQSCAIGGGANCQASGATQFAMTVGNAAASVNWVDVGLFAEDQWRLRSNMSLSVGLRYETQSAIHDRADFAPRLGFAWGLGHGGSAKTVLRAGFGMFYDRLEENQVLQAERLNGVNETQYVVANPDFFPTVPALAVLQQIAAAQSAKTIYQIDRAMRAPYTVQSAIGLERQVTRNATVSVTYVNSHGTHQFLTRNINAPLPGTYVNCPNSEASCTTSGGVRPYGSAGNIYQYESDGIFNQNQVITNFNVRKGTRLSLFGFYSLSFAKSNAAGINGFPSNSYDLAVDYGRAAFDVRHRLFLGGSLALPLGVRLSPFLMTSSGSPFNITVGQDLNGDSIYNDRPAFAAAGASGTNIIATRWGTFDTSPASSAKIIPVNYGTGPGMFEMNVRLSKTISFGRKAEATMTSGGMPGPTPGGGRGGPPPGGGGLGPGGLSGGGGGPGGPGGPFGAAPSNRRYSLTFGVGSRNLFNIVNLGTPIGQLTSPLFGKSNSLAGFGGMGGNRSIDFQMAFSF